MHNPVNSTGKSKIKVRYYPTDVDLCVCILFLHANIYVVHMVPELVNHLLNEQEMVRMHSARRALLGIVQCRMVEINLATAGNNDNNYVGMCCRG